MKIYYDDEKISLSQLKTRIGILISYYINLLITPDINNINKINTIRDLIEIAQNIGEHEHI